ncbi:hypothetical protein BC829DRAFT_412373 [Chytridium lagenaria]|nr:hypothetical protein BC829DRAFT_412373 [Chytridium lagenaria]
MPAPSAAGAKGSKSQTPSSASKASISAAGASSSNSSGGGSSAATDTGKKRKESAQSKEKKGSVGRDISAGSQADSKRGGSGGSGGQVRPESVPVDVTIDEKDAQFNAGDGASKDGPTVETKPKIDPERLQFLKDPVPPEIFSRLDNVLGKVIKSLPNLAVAWRREAKSAGDVKKTEGSVQLFAGTETLVEGVNGEVKPVEHPVLPEPNPDKLADNVEPTKEVTTAKRNSTAGLKKKKRTLSARGSWKTPALKLRERRLKRRRDRAAGVPPDPNDSDDSLLAELKEATDDKLFPGISFEDELDLTDAVMGNKYPSQFSTKLQFRDPRMLETSKGKTLNPSRKRETTLDLIDDPKTAERKDEMKVSHAKVMAKKEIDAVRRAAKEKEEELLRLEEDLGMCRSQLSKGTLEAGRLAREIKTMADREPRLKVSGLLVGHRQTDRLMATPEDPLDFQIPDEPHLNQNRAFRALKEEYMANKDLVSKALTAIPLLEQAIIPTEHELAALQLQESKLKELDQKLREADLIEDFEFRVVEKYRKLEADRKAEKKRRFEEKARREREMKEELEKRRREEVEKYELSRRSEEAAKSQETHRKEKALQDLILRVSKIRKSIEKSRKLKESAGAEDEDIMDSLKLVEGETDLSESLAIRQTRIQINKRKIEADDKAKQKYTEQEHRKMAIMKKLLREEILLNQREAVAKQEKELHTVLANMVTCSEDRAFPPVHYSAVLDVALKKRREEMMERIKRIKELEKERMDSIISSTTPLPRNENEVKRNRNRSIENDPFPASTPMDEGAMRMVEEELLEKPFKVVRRFLPPPRIKQSSGSHQQSSSSSLSTLGTALPFTAEPSEVIFIDYDPEKVYRKKILLTNTSCQVNTFRLLSVPVDIASYFEVLARPPGRMSAGMVCEVEFVFRPPPGYDQDVTNGQITFSAEHGGNFTVRIGCATRKCEPRIASVGGTGIITEKLGVSGPDRVLAGAGSKPKGVKEYTKEKERADEESHQKPPPACVEGKNKIVVDFGTCVLGDTVSRILDISNIGALETDFHVCEIDAKDAEDALASIESRGKTDCNSGRDKLFDLLASKYLKSKTSLSETDLKPEDEPPKEEVSAATSLPPDAATEDASPTVVDNTDASDILDELERRNFSVSKNERGLLQGYGSIPIHLEFSPPYVEPNAVDISSDPELAKRPPKKISYKAFYMIRFNLPNVDPLIIECRARHLESPLYLDTTEVDFGTCVVGSTYRLPLVIRNRSHIALKFWMEPVGVDRKMTNIEPVSHFDANDRIGSCIASDGIDSEMAYSESRDMFSEAVTSSGNNDGDLRASSVSNQFDGIRPSSPFLPPMLANYAHIDASAAGSFPPQPVMAFRPSQTSRKVAKRKAPKSKRSDSLTLQIPQVGEVEVSPRLAFIQPFESFTVWCKIRPSRGSSLLRENGFHNFKVPLVVKFNNHGIESPLSLMLMGSITTSDLSFVFPNGATSELSFGTCSVYMTKEVPVRIWNHSTVPQVAKFVGSMQGLSVVSNRKVMTETGLTVIPAMSQILKKIRFEPKEVGQHRLRLVCHSNWERKFEIVCTGTAVKPPLRFNATFIQFRTTSMGSFAEAKVKLIREKGEKDLPVDPKKKKSKEAWNDTSTINFDELYNDEYDVVGFEFGEPQLTSIRTRHGNYLTSEQLAAIQKEINMGLIQESEDAVEAVKKANKASTKEIKIMIGNHSPCWEETFNPTEFSKLFHQEKTVIQNKRVVITKPLTSTSNASTSSSCVSLAPAVGTQDAPPIEISPRKGSILPGRSVSIAIVLCPPTITALAALRADADKEAESGGVPVAVAADDGSKNRPPSGMKNSPERTSRSRQGTASADRPKGDEVSSPKPDPVNPSSIDQLSAVKLRDSKTASRTCTPPDESNTLYLEIVAPIVRPDILLIHPDSGTIDFERCLWERQCCKSLPSRTLLNELCSFSMKGLVLLARFHCQSPLEELGPESSQVVEVAFTPMGEATFLADFIVFTSTTQVRARLQGHGTVPLLQIDPPEALMHLGDVALGDTALKSFKIVNAGFYPLNCSLSLSTVHPTQPYPRSHGTVNFNRQNAFSLSINQVSIPVGSKQDVTIRFNPDRESDLFFDYITIDVWGIPNPHKIKVHGRCWDTSTALIGYDPPPETKEEDPYALPPKFECEFAQKMYTGNFPQELNYFDIFPSERPGATAGGDGSGAQPSGGNSQNTLSVGVGGTVGVPPPRNGSAEPKKTKSKDASKDSTNSSNLSEEFVADLLRLTSRESVRFVTVNCLWKKHEHRNTWYVETKELQIANLKPSTFTKPENTKRPPVAEFTIEPWEGTFEYMTAYNEYVQLPPPRPGLEDTMARFSFGDVTKGTVELGTTRPLKIQVHNPVKEFWTAMKAYEDLFNIRITDSVSQSSANGIVANNAVSPTKLSDMRKSVYTRIEPSQTPSISTTEAQHDTSQLPIHRPASSSDPKRGDLLATSSVSVADASSPLGHELGSKGRRRSSTSRSNLMLAVPRLML